MALKFAQKTRLPPPPVPDHVTPKPVNLPDFYEMDTTVWFAQVEIFIERQKGEDKIRSLFQVLPTNLLTDASLSSTDDFDIIKSAILKFYGDNQDQKFRKLLQEQQVGDWKPSAGLRQTQQLATESSQLVKLRFL